MIDHFLFLENWGLDKDEYAQKDAVDYVVCLAVRNTNFATKTACIVLNIWQIYRPH